MSSSNSGTKSSGIGIFGLLAIVFICLKLFQVTEVAQWSWWLVLAPLWAPLAIFLVVCAIVFAIALFANL